MGAKWELSYLFIAVRHFTSKVPATNLQLGQGSKGQLPSLCSFFPTAWPSQPGTWQLHLLCSGSRAISSNFRRWLLIGCFVSCRSQVKGHLLRKASHGPHPKWILPPPHCITPLCFTLPISLHDPSAAFLASPSPLQHAAALGVTRGDHYLEVFTKQSLEERYLE